MCTQEAAEEADTEEAEVEAKEEAPVARRYPLSRSPARTMAKAIISSATKPETVSLPKNLAKGKVSTAQSSFRISSDSSHCLKKTLQIYTWTRDHVNFFE